MFERLPNTYGQAFIENVWFANNRAYSTPSAYIMALSEGIYVLALLPT